MDEVQKEQIISAIYIAICNRNYRCARSIFDVTMMEKINERLDKVIELVETQERIQLTEKIQQLKYDV